jgi:hypothetical protein
MVKAVGGSNRPVHLSGLGPIRACPSLYYAAGALLEKCLSHSEQLFGMVPL